MMWRRLVCSGVRNRGAGGREGGQLTRASSFTEAGAVTSSSSASLGMTCSDLSTLDPGPPSDLRSENSRDSRDSGRPESLWLDDAEDAVPGDGDSSFSEDLLRDQVLVSRSFSLKDLRFKKLSRLSSLLETNHCMRNQCLSLAEIGHGLLNILDADLITILKWLSIKSD